MCVCVQACVGLSHFLTKLYISFIYEDIFTKFAENVYDCEKSTHFKNISKFKLD